MGLAQESGKLVSRFLVLEDSKLRVMFLPDRPLNFNHHSFSRTAPQVLALDILEMIESGILAFMNS